MTKTAWPLYLTIAVAAAASMATSPPPSWWESRVFQAPAVRLDQTHATDVTTFTVDVSRKYADPWDSFDPAVEVSGIVSYELDGAPQDLRIALVTPDQYVIAEQIHTLEGAGRLRFSLTTSQFTCDSDADVCEQTLAVEFDAGSVPGGAIDIEWYLRATTSGEGSETPEDLVFDVALDGGQAIPYVPELSVADPPIDEIGDGRWRMAYSGYTYLGLGQPTPRDIRRFSVLGEGDFSSSELSMVVTMSTYQSEPVELRLVVLPDEPGSGILAEEIVTLSGQTDTAFELRIPQILDCPEGACKRSFMIAFETEDAITLSADASVQIHAILDGEGETPPANVQLTLEVEDPYAL